LKSKHWCNRNVTYQLPFAIGDEVGDVSPVSLQLQIDRGPIVCPGPELEVALLVIEGEPRDIYLTRAEEEARRHPEAAAVGGHDDVGWEGTVDVLVSAEINVTSGVIQCNG
jgi:hypothetical protein